ncbi:MAG: TetR family transcriptional regulator [Deltaproteobacteria bacterium]|nr:TetR family transcriptional regulator [Deltaproteobacteria bacterium]
MPEIPPVASLRAKNKLKKREALVEAAMALFEANGFEATTVDQIADAAEVSRRTFFRYFPCKEAVVFSDGEERLAAFRALLAQPGPTPAARVRRACLAVAQAFAEDREVMLRRRKLMDASPALTAYDHEQDLGWEAAIADVLRDGARGEAGRRRAEVWAGAIMGAVRATMRAWYAGGAKGDLVRIGAEALDHLEMGMAEAMPMQSARAR